MAYVVRNIHGKIHNQGICYPSKYNMKIPKDSEDKK